MDQDALVETEEKYRKAMVFNAQLHNQKSALMYQVDALKEELMDLEEELWEERRRHDHALKVRGHRVATFFKIDLFILFELNFCFFPSTSGV